MGTTFGFREGFFPLLAIHAWQPHLDIYFFLLFVTFLSLASSLSVIPDKRLKDAKVWNPIWLFSEFTKKINVASSGHKKMGFRIFTPFGRLSGMTEIFLMNGERYAKPIFPKYQMRFPWPSMPFSSFPQMRESISERGRKTGPCKKKAPSLDLMTTTSTFCCSVLASITYRRWIR